ncbi:hypothetical protein LPB72_14625 [Hydrogenophaga crassostreae]|uniref:Flagellar hook-length control protein FliK n=1 Tax=Hydrogenophaga crassostreae TaxID=1763535 RepID=A0A167HGB1_9BURK|nr:hypothetical protein [Hydrogenophaga crassostreae]AOW12199.1 hypothetical protein LPB072_04375 [Hydrogenophaga crassostreae]OAD41144.1 hypothetical protein LPB72_14625 [Hydrogenophaga crassostreae]
MINIASSQPVHWPVSPTAVAVAPVSAVTSVKPAQQSPREGQSGLGSDRRAQTHASPGLNPKKTPDQEGHTPASDAAPILPRDKPKDGQAPSATQSQEDPKQQARDAQAAQDERSAQKQKLLDVLSSVWKASAAVVENALGRSGESVDGTGLDQAQKQAAQPAAPPVRLLGAPASDSPDGRVDQAATEPAVAYTEQGASEWNALELGRLVNKRA